VAIFVRGKFAYLYDIIDTHLVQVVFLAVITRHNPELLFVTNCAMRKQEGGTEGDKRRETKKHLPTFSQ
jgi:hypothetical protein